MLIKCFFPQLLNSHLSTSTTSSDNILHLKVVLAKRITTLIKDIREF